MAGRPLYDRGYMHMAKNTYEKREGLSIIFKIPFTEWTVRDENGRKIGTIRKDKEGAYEVHGGRYDANGNFISTSSGALRPTYRKAQAWFRNS